MAQPQQSHYPPLLVQQHPSRPEMFAPQTQGQVQGYASRAYDPRIVLAHPQQQQQMIHSPPVMYRTMYSNQYQAGPPRAPAQFLPAQGNGNNLHYPPQPPPLAPRPEFHPESATSQPTFQRGRPSEALANIATFQHAARPLHTVQGQPIAPSAMNRQIPQLTPVSRTGSRSPSRPLPAPRSRPESIPPPSRHSTIPIQAPQPSQPPRPVSHLTPTQNAVASARSPQPDTQTSGRPLPTPGHYYAKHHSLDLDCVQRRAANMSPILITSPDKTGAAYRSPERLVREQSGSPPKHTFHADVKNDPNVGQSGYITSNFAPFGKRSTGDIPDLPNGSLPQTASATLSPTRGRKRPERSPSPPKSRPLPDSPTRPPDLNVPSGLFRGTPQRPHHPPAGYTRVAEKDGESDWEELSDFISMFNSKPLTEESSKDIGGERTPSPQYGIRDLPTHTTPQRIFPGYPAKSVGIGPRVPKDGSVTLKYASMSIDDQSGFPTTKQGLSRQTSAEGHGDAWPSNLAPLPRTPGLSTKPFPSTRKIYDANLDYNLDDAPPPSLRRSPSPSVRVSPQLPRPPPQYWSEMESSRQSPRIEAPSPVRRGQLNANVPKISLPGGPGTVNVDEDGFAPAIKLDPPSIRVHSNAPQHSARQSQDEIPVIKVSPFAKQSSSMRAVPFKLPAAESRLGGSPQRDLPSLPSRAHDGGLVCGRCRKAIVGRTVSAMDSHWHPGCFRCTVCNELLEFVSSYEHEGQPYCHLDYHENFAPRCYHCKTAIIDERFITLDDAVLGKRTYHEQHFFCAECGDPFLAPRDPSATRDADNLNISGDGDFEEDDVGFTVYKGHPYCEACHVRLRMPKCARCKRSIRDRMRAVEALGGKWCWECFVCARCEKPFDEPSFFQRENKAFCHPCFSIILRNDI